MERRKLIEFFFLLVLCSCSDGLQDNHPDEQEKPHISICVLGNSYANDSFSYVPFILLEHGITCDIHIYYRGSGSLKDLDEQWEDESNLGIASLDGKNHNRFHFSIDTRQDSKWKKEPVASAKDIVNLKKWDVISLQQVSAHARYLDTYDPFLQHVIDKIETQCAYPFSFAWLMAYNRAKDNANEESVLTQKIVYESSPFRIIFPVATAIFSCQANDKLSQLGDSKYKKMYAEDNVHLQEGLPCYIAALTVAQTLLHLFSDDYSVMGDKIRPTQKWIDSINGITPDGESIGVSEENCALAQRAAIQANLHPFEIIPIQ